MKYFAALLLSAVLFVACSGESSSSAPDPIGEISSSSNEALGSSSSATEKKSSSSVSGKNSSSSVVESSSSGRNSSSSSAILFKQCEEGDTVISETAFKVFYYRCQDNEWVLDSTVNVVKPKVYPNMDSVFNPAVTYGSFRDPRDGKVYKTVQYYMEVQSGNTTVIDSFTVMTQNLNYADTIIDSTTTVFDDSKVEKRCYNDDPWYCDNYFGGLYTWSEALGLPKVCDSVGVADNSKCNVKLGDDAKVQGVCPEGWHVMNEAEWKHFAFPRDIDVSYALLSRAVWENDRNTNSSGLSVLPYGDGTYDSQNSMFWMAHEFKEKPKMGGAFMINGFSTSSASSKYGSLYVRCVMDEGDTFIQ
ncbi:FISUMP domain-containing protein [Fibrobacter sp. UWB10]|uniref:FISUMP domain-containing protein n=1 Tax=Fibrobacter sp. UWB10 TaxID=1896201 RepID=UPI0024039AB2|nr:FISUMP domain-containing protein [Fibrobacter sp. UWB10]SMP51780.1 major paralogous domain-containing protein [Fibrobacter sp. UWB10]